MTRALRFLVPAILALSAGSAAAQDQSDAASYPNRPIRMIVPFPAGGPSDIVARVIGQRMSEDWGQPVVIENRPGANTLIGAQAAAKAAPDGYTLFMAINSTLVMNQYSLQEPALRPAQRLRADHADRQDHVGAGGAGGDGPKDLERADRQGEGATRASSTTAPAPSPRSSWGTSSTRRPASTSSMSRSRARPRPSTGC